MPDARPADPAGRYIAGLDGLRAFSVMAVIGGHVMAVANLHGHLLDGGSTGVSVFFVISGFLITSLLQQEIAKTGTLRKRAFWLRRVQRLFPSLAVMLIATTLYEKFGRTAHYFHFTGLGLLAVAGYVGNWYTIETNQYTLGAISHSWSLAVEEQFYIVWPLFLALTLRLRHRATWLLWAVAFGGYLSALARVLLWRHGGLLATLHIYDGSETNAECILWGVALAIVARKSPEVVRWLANASWLGVAGLVALLEVPMSYASTPVLELRYVISPTLTGLATCTVIAAILLDRKVTRPLSSRPLTWIGRLSYDLYLWHFPVILALTSAGLTSASLILLCTAAICVPASMVTYELTRHIRHRGRAARSAGASPLPLRVTGSSPSA